MAKSKIIITFNAVPSVDDVLSFSNTLSAPNVKERFVVTRSNVFQSQIGYDNYTSALNYYNAIYADFGTSGLYNITIVSNVVTIESTISNAVFAQNEYTGSFATIVYDNVTESSEIAILNISFTSFVTDAQNKVNVNITTNVVADSYTHGSTTVNPNFANPIIYSMLRGSTELFTAVQIDGIQIRTAAYNIQAPDILASGNISVNVIQTPGAATATVYVSTFNSLILEYSLDGSTWQSSNVFTGLLANNYTVYIKDQLGGLANKNFSVGAFNPAITSKVPFTFLSETMSIRFKHNEAWDYNDIFKTDYNTLSCEEDTLIAFRYNQLFKPTNLITTQFLSNYSTLATNVIKEDGTKVALPLVVKTQFLDLKDKRDARIKNLFNGKTGIYYTAGQTYNYSTGLPNGTYALNGALPDYASIGNYIEVGLAGWFLIEDIIYDEVVNADLLVITYVYLGVDASIIVASNWNQKNYNVIEFKLDFALYNNQNIQVEILQSDTVYGTFNYLSEILEVSDYHKDTVEMIWYNIEDSLVFYSTGIKNVANVEFLTFNPSNDNAVTINKTTNSSIMVDSSSYDIKTLVLEGLSIGIMKQLVKASLHKEVYINRLKFVASEPPQVETVTNTNSQTLTLAFLSARSPFLSQQPGGQP